MSHLALQKSLFSTSTGHTAENTGCTGKTVPISFKCSEETKAELIAQAELSKAPSVSAFINNILVQWLRGAEQRKDQHSIVEDLEHAIQEARRALSDGVISPMELARITKPLQRAGHRLWNETGAA